MTIEFPTILYRCPGKFPGSEGTTFDSVGVENIETYKEFLEQGYHPKMVDAIYAFKNPEGGKEEVYEGEQEIGYDRKELESEAKKIGLKVDRRWSDETLQEKINESK